MCGLQMKKKIDGDVFSADCKMDEFAVGCKWDIWSVDTHESDRKAEVWSDNDWDVLISDAESDVWSADEEEIDGDVFSEDGKIYEFSGGCKWDVWSVDTLELNRISNGAAAEEFSWLLSAAR